MSPCACTSLGERLARVEERLSGLVKKADEAQLLAAKVAEQLHAWRALVVTSSLALLTLVATLFVSLRSGKP